MYLIFHVLTPRFATSCERELSWHYDDVIMSAIAAHITSLTIVYSTVYPGADQSKHQSSASLAFVCGIHRGPVNSPHKWPVTRKMFPFDDVIMTYWCPVTPWHGNASRTTGAWRFVWGIHRSQKFGMEEFRRFHWSYFDPAVNRSHIPVI